MFTHKITRRWFAALSVALSLALVAASFCSPARAAEPLKETTSLGFIPDDVGFYSTTLRNREKYEAFINSKAFARLKEMPFVKEMQQQIQNPFSPVGLAFGMLSQPGMQEPLALLGDMFSNEIFMYGDESYAELLQVFNRINSASQYGQFQEMIRSQQGGAQRDPGSAQARQMLLALNEHKDKLHVPNTVIGFKLTDTNRAKGQLQQLELMLTGLLAQDADLSNRFKKTKVGDHEYLTFTADGGMVPWDQVPIASMEQREGEFKALVEKLKSLKLTITLGLRDDHLLLAFGETAEHLKALDGDKLLYDRKELDPLRKMGDKKFSSVSYTSRQFAEKVNDLANQLNDVVKLIESLLPMLPAEQKVKDNLLADVKKQFQKLESSLPKPGAQLSFDYMTDRGFEGYSYDWGENKFLDGSKPLSLLKHVDGNPIGFYAMRTRYSPENYTTFVDIMKMIFHYGEEIALPQITQNERETYQKFRDAAVPLLEKLDKVTSEKLIPSLKDGQAAIVFDAKLKSSKWHQMMPPAKAPLPFPEFAIVYGVSDAKQLREACGEYFDTIQQLIDSMHEQAPREIPLVKIPDPQTVTSSNGTIFRYPIPTEWGLDPKIAPNAGLSEHVAVLTLSREHSERLLQSKPLADNSGPLAQHGEKPLAAACRFNWPGLVDMLKPWVEFGVEYSMRSEAISTVEPADEFTAAQQDDFASIMDQIATGAEILKCYKGYSSVTYIEGNAKITHRESVWQDLVE